MLSTLLDRTWFEWAILITALVMIAGLLTIGRTSRAIARSIVNRRHGRQETGRKGAD